jgi:hypothetical protein
VKGTVSLDSNNGAMCRYVLESPLDEAYLSYRIKFNQGFDPVEGGKTADLYADDPAVSIAGRCPDGTDGFDALVMFHGDPGSVLQRFYVYYPDQWTNPWYMDQFYRITGRYPQSCSEYFTEPKVYAELGGVYGASFSWDYNPIVGEWHTVTIRLAANTPGQKNGLVEAFIDGKMVSQVTDLRFRDIASLKINTAEIVAFFGGSVAAAKDEYIYYDDFIVYYYTPSSGEPKGNTPSPQGRVLAPLAYPEVSPTRE